jgi:hypothetical protein
LLLAALDTELERFVQSERCRTSSGGTKRFLPSPSAIRQMQFPFVMRTYSIFRKHPVMRSKDLLIHTKDVVKYPTSITSPPFHPTLGNPMNPPQPSVTQTQTTLGLVPNDDPTLLARTYVGTVHSLTARSRGLPSTSYDTIEGPFHMQTGYLDCALAARS